MVKLIKTLEDRFDCTVLTTGEGTLKKELTRLNINVDIVKLGNRANVFGGKFYSYSFIKKILALIEILIYNFKLIPYIIRNRFTIIYVNDIRSSFYVFLASKLLRRKLVCYIREELKDNLSTIIAFELSDKIITIAHGVLRNMPKKKIKQYNSKILNIYTGFNFNNVTILPKDQAKNRLGVDIRKINIGYVGSINPRKGIDVLINAINSLPYKEKKQITLTIAGDISEGYNDYWDSMQYLLNHSDIDYNYLGFQNNMGHVYNSLDMLVLPSRSEGLPRTVIEGMSYNLPVIATDVGGTKEIINNKEIGVLISKDSVEELAKAIKNLLFSRQLRLRMGERASKYVRSKFSEQKYRQDILRVFGEVANE